MSRAESERRASGWRVEVTDRVQPVVTVYECYLDTLTVRVQATYARRVFDARGTQIEGDHAPRLHTDELNAMRSGVGSPWIVMWSFPVD